MKITPGVLWKGWMCNIQAYSHEDNTGVLWKGWMCVYLLRPSLVHTVVMGRPQAVYQCCIQKMWLGGAN